jgi:hypothetical protein
MYACAAGSVDALSCAWLFLLGLAASVVGGLVTYGVVWLDEGVVDSDDVDVLMLDAVAISSPSWLLLQRCYSRIAKHDASNTPEAVDADLLVDQSPSHACS